MSKIIDLIQRFVSETFFDEDGNILRIYLSKGITLNEILAFEAKNKISLPHDLKMLLLFSNGLSLFGQKILSLNEMVFFKGSSVLCFHSWGNGDFDCISINKENFEETILFMSHSEDNLTPIHASLYEWIKDVINEIKQKGTLLHPYDYTERNEKGIYRKLI